MLRSHLIMALALSVIFGAGWVFGKTATAHFSPIFVATLRFGFAGVVLVAIFGWPKVPMQKLFFASACALGVPYNLSYIGLSRLDVSITVLLVQLEAPILIVLSAIVLREIPKRTTVFGVVLAVVGIVLVAGPPSAAGQYSGVLIVISSMFVWAAGQIQVRRFGLADGGLRLLGALSSLAAPQLLVLSLLFETGHATAISEASVLAWMQIAYLGLVMTVLGQGAWYFLVARYPLHSVAPFLLLVPVCSVAGGVIFLGERLTPATVLGGALIIAGVAVATLTLPKWLKRLSPTRV